MRIDIVGGIQRRATSWVLKPENAGREPVFWVRPAKSTDCGQKMCAATIPTAGMRKGLAGVREFFAAVDSAMAAQSFEPREFIAQGDQVVVLGDYSWKVKAPGRTFSSNWAHVATLKDGKVVRFREYTDTAAGAAAFA